MPRTSYPVGTIWAVVGDNPLEASTAAWVLADHMNAERESAWAGRFFLLDTTTACMNPDEFPRTAMALEKVAVRDDMGGVVVVHHKDLPTVDQYADGVVMVKRGKAAVAREPRGISTGEADEIAKRIEWSITVRRAAGL